MPVPVVDETKLTRACFSAFPLTLIVPDAVPEGTEIASPPQPLIKQIGANAIATKKHAFTTFCWIADLTKRDKLKSKELDDIQKSPLSLANIKKTADAEINRIG